MFAKYYTPPEVVGHPFKLLEKSRGKKHYWGVKGKNYGFYTSEEEDEMSRCSRAGRRIKT